MAPATAVARVAHDLVAHDPAGLGVGEAVAHQRHGSLAVAGALELLHQVVQGGGGHLLARGGQDRLRVVGPPRGRREQALLAAEVLHHERRVDAGCRGHGADGGPLVAGLGEQRPGRVEDRRLGPPAAFVPRRRLRTGGGHDSLYSR
jgi:hypothetical protein